MTSPTIVAVEMGYGHLRAAWPLADALSAQVLHADRPPLADEDEQRIWDRVRWAHESLSKLSQRAGLVGAPMRALLESITMIPPLYSDRDLAAPNPAVWALAYLVRRGLGRGLLDRLRHDDSYCLTTFYAPAIAAASEGVERVYCVVTDADIHRIWAPVRPGSTKIHYFAPSRRVVRRLQAYGVPHENITFTGFPLPLELVGDENLQPLRDDLAARLVRLDPEGRFRDVHGGEPERFLGPLPTDQQGAPVRITFAVGGAGAQADLADRFLPSLRGWILDGRLELNLVAGTRLDVARRFHESVQRAGLERAVGSGIAVVHEPEFESYYRRFNQILRKTDVLWTKPSELSFYAALGIPLILASPLGVHERFNRRWLREQGVALKQRNPSAARGWLEEWLSDGTLASAAWSGFVRLPKQGTHRIAARVSGLTLANRRVTFPLWSAG